MALDVDRTGTAPAADPQIREGSAQERGKGLGGTESSKYLSELDGWFLNVISIMENDFGELLCFYLKFSASRYSV